MPKKILKEEFEYRIKERFPDEKVRLINYKKASAPCDYTCLNCEQDFHIYKASELLRKKHLCNQCFSIKGRGEKTKEKQEMALKILKEKDLCFLGWGYNNKFYKSTIKLQCQKCKGRFEFQLVYFLNKQSCPYCGYNAKHLTTQGFKTRIPDDITLLEDYKGIDCKVLFRHEKCGFIWKTSPHNIINGCGCPKCNKKRSKGEQKIETWLKDQRILYETEKIFDWSFQKRYDFYLPKYQLVIEYMGIQHFKEVPFFSKTLEEQQKIDNWKKEQALKYGLFYLAISYEQFDKIETILIQRLSRKEST